MAVHGDSSSRTAGTAFFAAALGAGGVVAGAVARLEGVVTDAAFVDVGVVVPARPVVVATFFGAAFFAGAFFGGVFLAGAFFGAELLGEGFFAAAFFGAALVGAAFVGAAFFAAAFVGAAALAAPALTGTVFGVFADRAGALAAAFFVAEAFFTAAVFGPDLVVATFFAGTAFAGTAFAGTAFDAPALFRRAGVPSAARTPFAGSFGDDDLPPTALRAEAAAAAPTCLAADSAPLTMVFPLPGVRQAPSARPVRRGYGLHLPLSTTKRRTTPTHRLVTRRRARHAAGPFVC